MLSIKINQKKVAHFYFYFLFHIKINKKKLQLLIKICNELCVVLDGNLL